MKKSKTSIKSARNKASTQNIAAAAFILAGIAALTAGIIRGEAGAVWLKATRLCLECIGIG